MDRGWTRIPKRPGGGADLGARYEAVRAAALAAGGSRAELGAALLIAQGMAAWIRG